MTDNNNPNNNNTDVLVVGAGPTGLVAAIFLKVHGVDNVRIIDELPEPSQYAKATALQHRSMELLKYAGGTITKDLYDHGTLASNLQINDYSNGGENLLKSQLDTTPPGGHTTTTKRRSEILLNEQWHNEEVLTKRLHELGVQVERSKKLKALNDTGSSVEVTLEGEGEQFTTRFVIGCDGAHSFCRHHLDIEFKGEKFPRSYALVQANVDDMPIDRQSIRIDVGDQGWSFISPMPDGSYICVLDLTEEERAQCSRGQPSLEDLQRLLSTRGININKVHGDPIWNTYFNVHSRQASQYSKGRIFLAGDACHIHSPIGGQGMNMGIQDAHNLAWKMALVINGHAGLSLLDTYDTERHHVDRDVLKFVETLNANVSTRDAIPRAFLNRIMKTVGSFQWVLDNVLIPTTGQQLYNYRFSNLACESWGRISLFEIWKRRNQNILRLMQKRIQAGDRIPNWDIQMMNQSTTTPSGKSPVVEEFDLHDWLVGAGAGFKALIFEGLPCHKLSSDKKDLVAFAKELQYESNGLITGVGVIPALSSSVANNRDVYEKFGIQGQSLLLVRPDGYVGLRLEPLSVKHTMSYFATHLGATQVRGYGTVCKTYPDPIPSIILPTMVLTLGYFGHRLASQGGSASPLTIAIETVTSMYASYTVTQVCKSWSK